MKIGLLECDHVRDELLHIAGDYRQMFPALFENTTTNWEWVFYDLINGHFPQHLDECDAYLCTGSRFSVYDHEPWIMRLKTLVQNLYATKKTFVGVCFGHQMLAEALGGKVQKADGGWCVGIHRFQTSNSTALAIDNPQLLMMCQDQVVQLPPNAITLASSPDCPVAILQVGGSMLGIQAHPEFNKLYEAALINLRIEQIGAQKAKKALESLTQPTDARAVAGYVLQFIESNARH